MEKILISSAKKINALIAGIILLSIGITMSVIYDQIIGTVILSIFLGFVVMLFLIQFIKYKQEAKYQKEELEQMRSGIQGNRHLIFIFKYNFLFAGVVLSLNVFMLILSINAAVNSSIIVFSSFIGIIFSSSMVVYLQGREINKAKKSPA